MSRTYRLRKVKSKRTEKVVDSNVSKHRAEMDERFTWFVAHVIFNFPCKIIGKKIIEFKKSPYFGTDIETADHAKCIPFKTHKFRRSIWNEDLAKMMKYKVAPKWVVEPPEDGQLSRQRQKVRTAIQAVPEAQAKDP